MWLVASVLDSVGQKELMITVFACPLMLFCVIRVYDVLLFSVK